MEKQLFNVENLSGGGSYLVRSDRHSLPDTGFLSTVLFKVSYFHSQGEEVDNTHFHLYGLVSMSDGYLLRGWYEKNDSDDPMDWKFNHFDSLAVLADWLNGALTSSRWRFATHEELLRVVLYQTARFGR